MSSEKTHYDIFYLLLAFGILTIPFSIFFQLPVVLLLLVNFLIEWNLKGKYQNLRNNSLITPFILITGFYLLYVIGVTYSSNLRYAFSDLECKLFFFLMPFFIFTQNRKYFTRKKIENLFLLFVVAVIFMIIANIAISTYLFMGDRDANHFFYSQVSHFSHPSYSALYANTAFLLILYFLFINPIWGKMFRYLFFAALPVIAAYIFLLQSKAGVIVFLVCALVETLYIINRKKRRIMATSCFVLAGALTLVLISKYTPLMTRMQQAAKAIQTNVPNDNPQEGTIARIVMWKTAWQAGCENPILGVGTGDVKETLLEDYREQGFVFIANKQYNAHNQYLQTFVALGFIGLLFLAVALIYLLWHNVRSHNYTIAVWWLSVILNLLVECMFEVRAGTDFIATFGCLFCYYVNAFDIQEQPRCQTQL